MTGEELIQEGDRLARPCVHLCRAGVADTFTAWWRGPGVVPAPSGNYQHWLTVDCRLLPPGVGPAAGCLSVYTEATDRHGTAAHDPATTLPAVSRGGSPALRPPHPFAAPAGSRVPLRFGR